VGYEFLDKTIKAFKIYNLKKFFIIFLFIFGCDRKDLKKSIREIETLDIMKYTTRGVFEISFPKLFFENRILIEIQADVEFCVNLADLNIREENNVVIFSNLPKVKVCRFDIKEITDYDEDIPSFSISAPKNRREAQRIAQDSMKKRIYELENDPNIQAYLNTRLKEFLEIFVRNFKKEVRFE